MKRLMIPILIAVLPFAIFNENAHTNQTGAPAGKTGSPGDGGQTCNGGYCHTGPQATDEHIDITVLSLDSGGIYTITVESKSETPFQYQKAGFQACVEDENGEKIGTLETISTTETKIVSQNYITHKIAGTETSSSHHAWTFNWIPPEGFAGNATVYAASMLTNANGESTGDVHVLGNHTFYAEEVNVDEVQSFDFTVYPNPVRNQFNLSVNLDVNQYAEVSLMDSKGMQIQLFQGDLAQKMYEFIIPNHLANGVYTIKVATEHERVTQQILLSR